MYETYLFGLVIVKAWPVIKIALMAGAALYAYHKIDEAIYKKKRIKAAKTRENVNEKDGNGRTQLMSVSSLKEAKILLERGADINAVDNNGNNAAMYISDHEILALLVEKGIDVNAINKNGMSTLMLNAKQGNVKNMILLMKNGADTTLTDNNGKSALHHYLESAIKKRRSTDGKGVPAGCTVVNADILKMLLEPNEINPREKTKKIMSLQGIKGHKRMERCQTQPGVKEETIKETMTIEQSEKKKEEKPRVKPQRRQKVFSKRSR